MLNNIQCLLGVMTCIFVLRKSLLNLSVRVTNTLHHQTRTKTFFFFKGTNNEINSRQIKGTIKL